MTRPVVVRAPAVVSRVTEDVETPLPTAVFGSAAGSFEKISPNVAYDRSKPTVFALAILFEATSIDF